MPRPKKRSDQVRVTLSGSVLPEIEKELQAIALAEDRSKSWIMEKLLARGLAAYRRDGQLSELETGSEQFDPYRADPKYAAFFKALDEDGVDISEIEKLRRTG